MNILFIGDIFASGGRGIVAENLNRLITEHKIDLAIANSENSAGGFAAGEKQHFGARRRRRTQFGEGVDQIMGVQMRRISQHHHMVALG